MALEYSLIPNQMTSDPDDYMAMSRNASVLSLDDIFDDVTREGSTITRAEAIANYTAMEKSIHRALKQGHAVNTSLMNFSSSISGVFNSEEDTFDPNRHKINININAGSALAPIRSQVAVKKVPAKERTPVLAHFYDTTTETQDDIVSPGGGARISGSLLKVDESVAEHGIFFVNTATGAETKAAAKLLRNKPGELIFLVPQGLLAGSYRLEVRSLLNGNTQIRTGSLSRVLTVL